MENTKISALPSATTLSGTEIIPMVQGGVTKQATVSLISSTAPYPQIATFADLPDASDNSGKIYVVQSSTGNWYTFNKKDAGFYRSNGSAWMLLPSTASLSQLIDVAITSEPANEQTLAYESASKLWKPTTVTAMPNPMTAAGDIIIGGTSGTPARLAKGTDGQVCTLVSGVPAWGNGLLVAETVVSGSAVTSVTFSGLDGNTAGGYVLSINYVPVGASGNLSIYVNADTTATNYHSVEWDLIYGTSQYSGAGSNKPQLTGGSTTHGEINGDVFIARTYSGEFQYQYTGNSKYSNATRIQTSGRKSTGTITNITSLTIQHDTASNIGIGSTFRLYRRK